jgi:hypothetical protein
MLTIRTHRFAAVSSLAGLLALAAPGVAAGDEGLGFGNEIDIEAVAGALEIEGDDLELEATNQGFRFDGPGYRSSLAGAELQVDIDLAALGLRDDDDGVNPVEVEEIPLAGFTIPCGANSYSFTSGELVFTSRTTSDEDRPPPYSGGFNAAVPIGTLIGEITGTVTNQNGETLQVFGIDSLDEVLSDEGFSAVTGVQLNFVDGNGVVADRVAFSGSFNGDGAASETVIVDHGTCRALVGPGIVVAGPFFVFPFVADRLITIQGF